MKQTTTDLSAEILAKASKALLVEAQQREELEKPFYLCQVNSCHGLIQLLGNNHPQFLLRFLKQQQAGIHVAACVDTITKT